MKHEGCYIEETVGKIVGEIGRFCEVHVLKIPELDPASPCGFTSRRSFACECTQNRIERLEASLADKKKKKEALWGALLDAVKHLRWLSNCECGHDGPSESCTTMHDAKIWIAELLKRRTEDDDDLERL